MTVRELFPRPVGSSEWACCATSVSCELVTSVAGAELNRGSHFGECQQGGGVGASPRKVWLEPLLSPLSACARVGLAGELARVSVLSVRFGMWCDYL
jgi:hypothetical protein